jgi:hypothetical protein
VELLHTKTLGKRERCGDELLQAAPRARAPGVSASVAAAYPPSPAYLVRAQGDHATALAMRPSAPAEPSRSFHPQLAPNWYARAGNVCALGERVGLRVLRARSPSPPDPKHRARDGTGHTGDPPSSCARVTNRRSILGLCCPACCPFAHRERSNQL